MVQQWTLLKKPASLLYLYEIGWLAFWFEAVFLLNDGDEFVVSSDTFIAPELYLSEECHGEDECRGSLV